MPILYRNIMDGLPDDAARSAFLFYSDKTGHDPMLYRAEAFARNPSLMQDTLNVILDAASRQHGDDGHDPDLMHFFLTREANWRLGGNVAISRKAAKDAAT